MVAFSGRSRSPDGGHVIIETAEKKLLAYTILLSFLYMFILGLAAVVPGCSVLNVIGVTVTKNHCRCQVKLLVTVKIFSQHAQPLQ